MTEIKKIKNNLALNPDLDKNLSLLVDISIKNKTLIFDNIDDLNIEILKKAEVLRLSSDKYRIDQYSFFGYKFYQKYKNLLKVKLTKDFKALSITLKKIDSEFNADKYNQGFSSLNKELWAFAILETNKKFQSDFTDYIASLKLKKDKEEIFSFNEGYSMALPFMEINTESFYTNSKQLIDWTNSDADYNFPLGSLLNGIRDKIFRDSEFGLNCLGFVLKQKEIVVELLIPIITGLYNKLGISFFKSNLEKLISNDKYSIPIICGLSNVKSIRKEEAELLLQLYEKFNKKSPEILVQLPKLLFAILKSDKLQSNSKYFKTCFLHLEELISINSQDLIHFILRNHEYEENHIDARQNLILKLIEKPHFKIEKYLNSINQFLWVQKDIIYFEQIINSLAQNCSFQSIAKLLNSSIYEFLGKNKVGFDEVLIRLLINDKSSHRFLGLDIFNEISQSSYTFDFNILTLDSLSQYKLWVTVCQNYRQPKYIIPCLLPLFKSSSPIVKEAFICKMEEYSENYGGFVTDVIKSNLDFNDIELKEIYGRIEKYRDEYYTRNVLVKQEIKELNPFYTQYKSMKQFNALFHKLMNQSYKKAEKNSLISMIGVSTVKLAKGGGWKIGNRKEISKLGTVGTSFSLPRSYFINPNEFDMERNYEMRKDWTDSDFVEIRNCLDNE